MVPRTTLVTQNSARSDRSGLAFLEATSAFAFGVQAFVAL